MKNLWFVIVGLGMIYYVVWGITKQPQTVNVPKVAVTAPDYAGIAVGDAITQVPGATFERGLSRPMRLNVTTLEEDKDGEVGAEVTLTAKVDEKPVARLTYHVLPPEKKKLVKRENL